MICGAGFFYVAANTLFRDFFVLDCCGVVEARPE